MLILVSFSGFKVHVAHFNNKSQICICVYEALVYNAIKHYVRQAITIYDVYSSDKSKKSSQALAYRIIIESTCNFSFICRVLKFKIMTKWIKNHLPV